MPHQHSGYVQDVRYADFAGAKIGDAAVAEKDTHRDPLREFVWRRVVRLPYHLVRDNNLFGILFH